MVELIKKENHFQMLSKSVREIDTETGKGLEIEGYASTKDKDRYGDIVQPEAFEKAMNTYALNPILLLQHDADKPIGKVDAFTIDGNGLYIKAVVTEDIDGVMNKLKNGVLKGFSIGYRLLDYEVNYTEDDEGNITDYTNIIKELELLEISLVSIPANPYALRKSIDDCFSSKSMEMPEEEKTETPEIEEKEEAVEEATEEEVKEEENKEIPNEEAEQQEICEEESENKEADEQSEISDEENEEAEKSDEKPDTEVKDTPEEKSFELIRKEFKEEIKSKDAEIKAFAEKTNNLEKKLSETIAVLGNVVEAMKGMHDTLQKTVVENSFQYNGPIVKDKSADAIEKAVKTMKSW